MQPSQVLKNLRCLRYASLTQVNMRNLQFIQIQRSSLSSNPFQKLKLELERKYQSFGGFDWSEFAAPFRKNKTRKDMGHNPFFAFFYEQCQKKHALQIAERMGVSVRSVTFDGNKAYIDSNLPIPKHQMDELARGVKQECPMSKINDMVGNQETEWIQKK